MNKIIIDKKKVIVNKSGDYDIEIKNSLNEIEIIIEKDLNVRLFYIDMDNEIKEKISYKLLDRARLVVYKFYNNKSVKEDVLINLDGYGSNIEYFFSGISNNEDKYNCVVNHNNKMVNSKVVNHLIAIDNASIYFNIDSNVEHGNSGSIMDQNTKIINLGENKSRIHPNMNIREYDVKASHGSVIGKFREEDIFYLMSRGISYDESLKLLIKGFLLAEFKDKEFSNKIKLIIDKYWR